MYRTPSPIFDVHDNAHPRKVKPLPKRRRTDHPIFDAGDIAATQAFLAAAAERGHDLTMAAQLSLPLPLPLPNYYMPLLAGMQDMLRTDRDSTVNAMNYNTLHDISSGGQGQGQVQRDDDEHGDGDYDDHLQQPGNTKKRKVPLAHHSSYASDVLGNRDGMEDWATKDRTSSVEYVAHEEMDRAQHPPDKQALTTAFLPARKSRLSIATRAGLHHKELLQTRKRQLTAVLGAMYNGDSLALDQALSSAQPFLKTNLYGPPREGFRVRPSLRPSRKSARLATKAFQARASSQKNKASSATVIPCIGFTMNIASTTSDRLAVTREEVAALQARFESELAQQAAKAAEAAKQTERGLPASKRNTSKQGASTAPSHQDSPPNKSRGSKKKKRSAMANASNPHHLRNYVPSRVPHSGQPPLSAHMAAANAQNLIGPLPLRFLSAELPARHRKTSTQKVKSLTMQPSVPLTTPGDEWICAFCEYDIFFGEESGFRRAIRNRKKILSRRRRAREKAAATASGTKDKDNGVTASSSNTDSLVSPDAESVRIDDGADPVGADGNYADDKTVRERG